MLQRNIANQGANPPSWWEELGFGAPTIAGFARLCSDSIQDRERTLGGETMLEKLFEQCEKLLSDEAKIILALSQTRGTFEIRANRDGFDAAERFLAVAVELELDRWRVLLDKRSAEQTVRFLEGFRELCAGGLVIHHMQREFSLSSQGFDVARKLETSSLPDDLLDYGFELES